MAKKPLAKTEAKAAPVETSKVLIARWFVIGDLHLMRTDPLGVIGPEGINTRLRDRINALKFIVDQAVAKQATHIVFLGDIYNAVNPPEMLQKLFWETIEPLLHLPIRIIIGNHDSTKQTYNFSGHEILLPPKTVLVHDHGFSETIHCPSTDIELTIQYIPYKSTKEEVLAELKKEAAPALLFGHFEIAGSELSPDNTIIRQGVAKEDVNGRLIWLGHIHKFQEFRPGYAYLGSVVKCDFGEINNKKVFGIADIYSDGEIKYVYEDIPQRPMYVHDIKEIDPDNLYLAKNVPAELAQEGVLIKFKFIGSMEWIKSLDKTGFKKRFPKAMRVVTEDVKLDSDRIKSEYTTSLISDHVHQHCRAKKKGKEYLDIGVSVAEAVAEIEL